jgi:hypothetical protein
MRGHPAEATVCLGEIFRRPIAHSGIIYGPIRRFCAQLNCDADVIRDDTHDTFPLLAVMSVSLFFWCVNMRERVRNRVQITAIGRDSVATNHLIRVIVRDIKPIVNAANSGRRSIPDRRLETLRRCRYPGSLFTEMLISPAPYWLQIPSPYVSPFSRCTLHRRWTGSGHSASSVTVD